MSEKQYPTKVAVNTKEVPAGEPVVAAVLALDEPAPASEPVAGKAAGAVVADATVPVGAVSTPVEIKAVQAQKQASVHAASFSPSVKGLIEQLRANGNQVAVGVLQTLEQYMTDMAPGKMVTDAVGAKHQVLLFRCIQTAINGVEKDFPLLFATILKVADDHVEGVFNARYLFRFMKDISLNADDRQAFMRIMNLITTAAPVSGRVNAVKFVDFGRTLEFGFSEEGKKKVLGFFNK